MEKIKVTDEIIDGEVVRKYTTTPCDDILKFGETPHGCIFTKLKTINVTNKDFSRHNGGHYRRLLYSILATGIHKWAMENSHDGVYLNVITSRIGDTVLMKGVTYELYAYLVPENVTFFELGRIDNANI